MKKIENKNTNSYDSYINKNRSKLDESLISLRFMKEVDNFIDINQINQRQLANDIGYTEAYVSQLMSGVKKVNTSFINKFEKKYDVKVLFNIIPKKESNYITSFSNNFVEINLNVSGSARTLESYSSNNKNQNDYCEIGSELTRAENNA